MSTHEFELEQTVRYRVRIGGRTREVARIELERRIETGEIDYLDMWEVDNGEFEVMPDGVTMERTDFDEQRERILRHNERTKGD